MEGTNSEMDGAGGPGEGEGSDNHDRGHIDATTSADTVMGASFQPIPSPHPHPQSVSTPQNVAGTVVGASFQPVPSPQPHPQSVSAPQNVAGSSHLHAPSPLLHSTGLSVASGDDVARHTQDTQYYTTYTTINQDSDREQLNEIERVTGRTRSAVTTLEGKVDHVIREMTSIKNIIKKNESDQAERMGRVERAVSECQQVLNTKMTGAAELAGAAAELKEMQTLLDDRARDDKEWEAERKGIREAVDVVSGVVSEIKDSIDSMNNDANRSRSDQWTKQLQDFLDAQKEANSHVCTPDRHSNECVDLFIRGLRPGTSAGGSVGASVETKDVYKCGRCSFFTDYKGNLTKHIKTRHPGKTSDANRQNLGGGEESDDSNANGRRHPGRSPFYKRPKMDFGSKNKKPSQLPVDCQDCGGTYSNSGSLNRHVRDGSCARKRAEQKPKNVVAKQGGPSSTTSASGSTETDSIPKATPKAAIWKSFGFVGKTEGRKGVEDLRESGGATGGSPPGSGGAAGEDGEDTRGEAPGVHSGDEVGDIISDEGDVSDEVDEQGNPVRRDPFGRPTCQRRENRRK